MEKLIFVQGPPGAGKSTLSRDAITAIGAEYELTVRRPLRFLPVGAHVRSILRGDAPSRFSALVEAEGEAIGALRLCTPFTVHQIVQEHLSTHETPGTTIVDGYPRDMELIQMLQYSELAQEIQVLGNVEVQVDDELSINRQLDRRSVDGHPVCDLSTARRRTAEYRNNTHHVVEAVREIWGGELVDGARPILQAGLSFTNILRTILRV